MNVAHADKYMACLDLEDDRRWLEENLEDRVFRNSGEAERSLGLR
jgi:hypothetical protein